MFDGFQSFLAVFDEFGGKPIWPNHVAMRAVMNVIQSIVTGRRCEYDDPDFNMYLGRLKFAVEAVSNSGAVVVFPFLK